MQARITFLVSTLTLLAGCISLPPQYEGAPKGYALESTAANVKVVEFIPTAEREKYDEIEMLSCALGFNLESVEANIESCNNHFKNEAHRLGSDLVWVKPETKRVGVDTFAIGMEQRSSTCTECVDMKGFVLKPKSSRQ